MMRTYLALGTLSLAGCMNLDVSGQRCSEALECGSESICYRGFCVGDDPIDAGDDPVDGGSIVALDAGNVVLDAGTEIVVVDAAPPAPVVEVPVVPTVTEQPDASVQAPTPDPEPIALPLVDASVPDATPVSVPDAAIKPVDAGTPSCSNSPTCSSKGKGNGCKPCDDHQGGP